MFVFFLMKQLLLFSYSTVEVKETILLLILPVFYDQQEQVGSR